VSGQVVDQVLLAQAIVNNKKWYMSQADLWTELGDEYHLAGKNLLKGNR
jgi:hypothetical protein